MDIKTFWLVFAIGVALVTLQGVLSYFDNRLSQTQLEAAHITNSYSFLQHGGMWADVFIISPIVAYAFSRYEIPLMSWWTLGAAIASAAIVLVLVEQYRRAGIVMGDHCTHDGYTTPAGWVHGLFAFAAIFVCLQIYLGLTTPVVSKLDIVLFSLMLTPFWDLGVRKFTDHWAYSQQDKYQVMGGITAVWIVAAIRLVRA